MKKQQRNLDDIFRASRKKSDVRESETERYFVKCCKKEKWLPIKCKNPYERGWPDRQIFLVKGLCVFAELKKPDKDLRPEQEAVKCKLESRGFLVWVIKSKEDVDNFVFSVKQWLYEKTF